MNVQSGEVEIENIFSIGSRFSIYFKERTINIFRNSYFWDKVSSTERILQRSRRFKDEEPVELKGPGHLCTLYLDALKASGKEGFQKYSGRSFKQLDINELFSNFSNMDLANALFKQEKDHCVYVHLDLPGLPRAYLPLAFLLLDTASHFCPLRGVCDNSQKKVCAKEINKRKDSIKLTLDLLLKFNIYYPPSYPNDSFRQGAWSSFDEIEGTANSNKALALMDHTIFGLTAIPLNNPESFYCGTGNFAEAIVSDFAFTLGDKPVMADLKADSQGLLSGPIIRRIENALAFSAEWLQAERHWLLRPLLVAYALQKSSETLSKNGVRINLRRTIGGISSLITRDILNQLIEASDVPDPDISALLDIYLSEMLKNDSYSWPQIILDDDSAQSQEEVRRIVEGISSKLTQSQMSIFPLGMLIENEEVYARIDGPYFYVGRINVRTGRIRSDALYMAPPPVAHESKTLLQQICGQSGKQLVDRDFEKYAVLEALLNERIWDHDVGVSVLPTNRDVYSYLKGAILNNKAFVTEKLRHLHQDTSHYSSLVILVFDGLGYVPLKWAALDDPQLSRLTSNESRIACALSESPSFTAVNHCMLLNDVKLYDDYFIDRRLGPLNAQIARFQEDWGGTPIVDSSRCLFKYSDDGEFISQFGPDRSHLSSIISSNCVSYVKADGFVDAIKKALKTKHKLAISQVNVMDHNVASYSNYPVISDPQSFVSYAISQVKDAFEVIHKHIPSDCLVLVVSDHGLGWWPSRNTMRLEEAAQTIVSSIPGCSWSRDEKGDRGIELRRNNTPIALMKPDGGFRRVASIFGLSQDAKLICTSKGLDSLRRDFEVNIVDNPRPFDPILNIVGKNKLFSNAQSDGKYCVGLHGGLSAWESLVPVLWLNSDDWKE